jgi:DNA-binding transcriptional regulator of glucitol operon
MAMRRLLTPRWLLIHAAAVILVVGFLLLCWWQVSRARNGNLLSFGYALEWPAFAAFVVYVWVKEMRQALQAGSATEAVKAADPRPAAAATPLRRRQARSEAAYDDTGEPELAAYNRYLTWLNAHPHASRSEYPG